jgi:hypothetical protein
MRDMLGLHAAILGQAKVHKVLFYRILLGMVLGMVQSLEARPVPEMTLTLRTRLGDEIVYSDARGSLLILHVPFGSYRASIYADACGACVLQVHAVVYRNTFRRDE